MKKIIVILFVFLLTSKTYCAEPWVNESDMLGEINGTVIDGTGAAVPGALLQWQNAELFLPNLSSGPFTADENGKFKVPADMKNVFGMVLCVSNSDGTLFNDYHIGKDSTLIELDNKIVMDKSEINDAKFIVYPTRQITGVVHDTGGHPVHGASIYTPFMPSAKNVVKTDENGKFTVTFMRYPNFSTYFTVFKPEVGIATVSLSDRKFSVKTKDVDGKEPPYELPQPVVLSKTFGPVKVQVVDNDGKPVPSVAVAHFRTPVNPQVDVERFRSPMNINPTVPDYSIMFFRELYPFFQKTDENGFAVINVPNPEDLTHTTLVTMSAPYFIPCKIDVKSREPGENGVIRITTPDVHVVRGTLRYPDGKPAANIPMMGKIGGYEDLKYSQKNSCVVTDSLGRYELPIRPLESRQSINQKMYEGGFELPFCFSALDDKLCAPTALAVVRHTGGKSVLHPISSPQFGVHVRKTDSGDEYYDLTLVEKATIRGKVLYDNDENRPIEDALIRLEPDFDLAGNADVGVIKVETFSEEDGSYSLRAAPGKYKIMLFHDANAITNQTRTDKVVWVDAGKRNKNYRLDEAEPGVINITETKLYNHNIASSVPNGIVCRGTLLSSDNKPVSGELIRLMLVVKNANNANSFRLSAGFSSAVMTDEDGKFVFKVPPSNDETFVSVVLNTVTQDKSACAFVSVGKNDLNSPVKLTLKPTVSISGRLIDPEANKPHVDRKVFLTNVRIVPSLIINDEGEAFTNNTMLFYNASILPEAITDESGRFKLDNLPDYLLYDLNAAKTVPEQFSDAKQIPLRAAPIGSVDSSALDGNDDFGDIELFADALLPNSNDYQSYLLSDTRPYVEKLGQAKRVAKKEKKRILVSVQYTGNDRLDAGNNDYNLQNQLVQSFCADMSAWEYVFFTVTHNKPSSDSSVMMNAAARDALKVLEILDFSNDDKRRTMVCLLSTDGDLIRKIPIAKLMQSDDEWNNFFAE